jgi:serine protease Do
MQMDKQKGNINFRHFTLISTFFLFMFVTPLSVLAQNTDSIAVLRQMGKAFASIAEKTSLAVVSIKSEKIITREYSTFPDLQPFDPFGDDFFDFFFRRRSPQRPQERRYREPRTAQGSGFIITSDGYILTNNHMVEGAENVEVELTNGKKFTAEITGTDPDSDLALIKIDATNLPYLELADSDKLEVGEWVLAIGNPLGLSHTVTAGIVSAKGRSGFGLADIENFIQTDAAINFGNSGGPLINLDGKVVGINTAIAGSTGNIGIGFAIPINMAKYVYEQLIETGTVERGLLGVRIQELTPDKAPFFGLDENTKGVLIPEVTKGSAADKAGLTPNDVILEVDGEPVETPAELQNLISMQKPGTEVELTIWRDGKRTKLNVKLGKRSAMNELTGTTSEETTKQLGFTVENLTDELASRYGYEDQKGVIVSQVEPGSQANREGIAEGALIKAVDMHRINNTREFDEAIEKAKKRGKTLLLVQRDRYIFYVTLNLSEK